MERDVALQEAAARVAVLPFESLSEEPGYLARGFVQDLVTELSRFPALEVLHADTSLAGPSPWMRDGTYALRGSVRRSGDVVRISVQLVEAGSGQQRWAGRFDAAAHELLEVQDEIAARVASALVVEIDSARLARARRKPLASLEVYDCWLRGLDALHDGTLEGDARARTFFERALAIDPDYARAYAGLSLSHFNEWSCQAWELWDEKERLAFEHASRAAALDDGDAIIQIVLGRILLYRRAFDEAARHIDRALALNPSDADVLAHAALSRAYLGDASSGEALARKAMRLHPRHPEWYITCLVAPLFALERYAEAHAIAIQAPRSTVDMAGYIAAGAALRGDMATAARYLDTFLADFEEKVTFGRAPELGEPLRWILHVNPYRRAEDVEPIARGLHLAGLSPDPDAACAPVRSAPPAATATRPAFRRAGSVWEIDFDGTAVRLSDVKGLYDLGLLLAQPGRPVHCLELAGSGTAQGGGDPILDERARRELRARVRDLEADIEEGEALADVGRVGRARAELDQLVETLAGALGLGGRPRQLGSPNERARSAVTWRIRSAIRKIAAVHPALGRHLENAVRTGTTCVYQPERPVDWQL